MNTTTDGNVTYESKTVRAIRGTESRTIAKWTADGWEVVSQSLGTIRTEITFRRPAPKSRRTLLIAGGVVAALALATIAVVGALTEDRDAADASSEPILSEPSAPNEGAPSADDETVSVAPAEPADAVLTPQTSPELASVLTSTDYCSSEIAAFASLNSGRTISFPGSVGAIAPYEDTDTRYLILINAGDYSETSTLGPAFQFRDVNTTYDLRWADPAPDTISVGTNLNVTAKVDRYEDSSCLFLIDPVATAVR
ncbi:DUF4839 domain-containing protein [Rhodococcus sp. NPDC003994]